MKFNKAYGQLRHLELPTRAYLKHSGANTAETIIGSEYGPGSVSKRQGRKPERKRLGSRAVYGQVPAKEITRQAVVAAPRASGAFAYGMPDAGARNLPNLAPKPVRQYRRKRSLGWESTGQASGWRAERASQQDALAFSQNDRPAFKPRQKCSI